MYFKCITISINISINTCICSNCIKIMSRADIYSKYTTIFTYNDNTYDKLNIWDNS